MYLGCISGVSRRLAEYLEQVVVADEVEAREELALRLEEVRERLGGGEVSA